MRARCILYSFTTIFIAAVPVSAQPVLDVVPTEVIEGEPIHVVVKGLRPRETVTLRASRLVPTAAKKMERYWSQASYVADESGRVDLRTSTPLRGSSYDRADPAGLFWSMISEKRADIPRFGDGHKVGTASTPSPETINIEVESAGKVIAHAEASMRSAGKDVVVREIREPTVTAVFARNTSATFQPVVIVLGGSEGGLETARWAAPLIASYGYTVLGLGYFQGSEPGLSALPANLEKIPLETIVLARDWLSRQRGVDTSRIALVGVSKGAELALISAATYPWVTAVAAFAPSHVVWEGIPPDEEPDRSAASSWTFHGEPLPFVRWSKTAERRGDTARNATGSSRLTEVHLESLVEFAADIEAATIPIEKSKAAIFIAAGSDDGMWPSAYSAELIRRRLALRDLQRDAVFEVHPTGHQIMGSGWAPTTTYQRTTGRLQGGTARLDAEAQKTVWPSFLKFLNSVLQLHPQSKTGSP